MRPLACFEHSIEAAEHAIGPLARSSGLLKRAKEPAEHSNEPFEPAIDPAAVNDSRPNSRPRLDPLEFAHVIALAASNASMSASPPPTDLPLPL